MHKIYKSRFAFISIGVGVIVLHIAVLIILHVIFNAGFEFTADYIVSKVLFSGQQSGIIYSLIVGAILIGLNIWSLLNPEDDGKRNK
ncbi:hypothetical protein CYG49_00305 [Candidatus Saccharibacteria bacterium]|nr:MAG: hypothetical protein CYG49_00305 [Candidatus Saccharibacteria bacterium]